MVEGVYINKPNAMPLYDKELSCSIYQRVSDRRISSHICITEINFQTYEGIFSVKPLSLCTQWTIYINLFQFGKNTYISNAIYFVYSEKEYVRQLPT